MSAKDGGYAFSSPGTEHSYGGMSLRDWFAGQALMGLMSGLRPNNLDEFSHMATRLYQVADAMLAARGEKP